MVSDGRSSPPPRRARLARHLRRLRDEKRLTVAAAARRAGWSTSKLSRIETSLTGVIPADVAKLLSIYGVTGIARQALLNLASEAQRKEPTRIPSATVYVELEAEATALLNYEASLVPGILQIADYFREIAREQHPEVSSESTERLVERRLGRQALLTRQGGPRFHFIVEETALRRPVGGARTMGAQLRHLAEQAILPSVTLQVLQLDVGAHPGLTGMFTVFDVPDDLDPGAVYLEHFLAGFYLDAAEDVARYTELFHRLSSRALEADDSVRLIRRLAEGLD